MVLLKQICISDENSCKSMANNVIHAQNYGENRSEVNLPITGPACHRLHYEKTKILKKWY